MQEEKFDIFIAYYGGLDKGSQTQAEVVYDRIQGMRLPSGKTVNAYFHPRTNPHGVFEETPNVVMKTPLFLLVADSGIPRDEQGMIMKYRGSSPESQRLSNLYEEVRTFHGSLFYKRPGGDNAAKLFLTDSFDFAEAERLYPIFSGKVAFINVEQIVSWLKDMLEEKAEAETKPESPDRSFVKAVQELSVQQDVFMEGGWVEKAEKIWKDNAESVTPSQLGTVYEDLGRFLLVYYCLRLHTLKYDSAEYSSLHFKAVGVYHVLNRIPSPQRKTSDIVRNEAVINLINDLNF